MVPRVRALGGAHSPTRRVRASVVAASCVLALAAARPARAQLAVDQGELMLHPASPGGDVAAVTVQNTTDRALDAKVYAMDWDRDTLGNNRFYPSGTVPQSCAAYLQIFPLTLRLPARSTGSVRIALRGADALAAACWSVIFIETRSTPTPGVGRTITYVARVGVKVYGLPSGLSKDGEVEDLAVDTPSVTGTHADTGAAAAPGPRVAISFRNTGGLPLVVHGAVEYRRLDNTVVGTDSLPDLYLLPGALRRASVVERRLPPGQYVILALLDYGGADVAAGQMQITVP